MAARGVVRGGVGLGVGGMALTVVGWAGDPRQAFFSYLTAWSFWLSIALGALLLVMIHHTINASWFVVLRRLAEGIADPFIVFAILFIPLLFGLRELYPWIGAVDSMDVEAARAVEAKRAYLNAPFFLVRSAAYFVIWIVVGQLLRRWSLAMGEVEPEGAEALALRQRTLSAVALPVVGFALTFASFDWLMSLTPTWYSTIYGVYFFAGGILAALALLAVVVYALRREDEVAGAVTTSHVHAMGKLILTFLIFWAYIGYAQLLLIWIADIPVEASWYVVRLKTRWSVVGWVLLVGHFAVPLLALLSYTLKRRAGSLGVIAAWLLVMHYVDVYWLVLPALHTTGPRPHWLDLTALAGVGGLVTAFAVWRLRGVPLVPVGDPRIEKSKRFVTR